MRSTFLTALVAGVLVVGCGDSRLMQLSDDGRWLTAPMGPGLIAQEDSPIPDLPMPIGFIALADRSRVQSVGAQRYVLHVYQGQAPMEEALRFYRQQTKLHGWRWLGEQGRPPHQLLWYQKGSEQLTIQLDRVGNIVTVTVFIEYVGPDATPPRWVLDARSFADIDF